MASFSEQLDRLYRPVSWAEAPSLHAAVEDLCARAGVPKPKICFIDSSHFTNALERMNLDWNAFASNPDEPRLILGSGIRTLYGHHHGSSAVSDELKAVLAHEISHLKNNDVAMWKMHAWRRSPFALGIAAIVGTWYYQHLKDVEATSRAAGKPEDEIWKDTQAAWEASGAEHKENLGMLGVLHPGVAAARSIAGGLLGLTAGFGLYALHSRHIEFRADRGAAELLGSGEPMARALVTLHNEGAAAFDRLPKEVVKEHRRSKGPLELIYNALSHPKSQERVDRLMAWSH